MPRGKRPLESAAWLERFEKKHGGSYDYSGATILNGTTKIDIKCFLHGSFRQSPSAHASGRGCGKCKRNKRGARGFFAQALNEHGHFYDYSRCQYRDWKSKVEIKCPKHGYFKQTPAAHIHGQGCEKCGYEKAAEKNRKDVAFFLQEANTVHNGHYTYGRYTNSHTKMDITCPEHGRFEQRPGNHLKGAGCPECYNERRGASQRGDTDSFVKKAINVHQNTYDYSLVEYVSSTVDVVIVCEIHGKFLQSPERHLASNGCPMCSRAAASVQRRLSPEEFITRATAIHSGRYNYPAQYVIGRDKIHIGCPRHGEFTQAAESHLRGAGCPSCKAEACAFSKTMDTQTYITKAAEKHGGLYDYSRVEYGGGEQPICIFCPDHGPFWRRARAHLHDGSGCPRCSTQGYSKMEIAWLTQMERVDDVDITHAGKGAQHSIKLKGWRRRPVDGYAASTNTVYQFHGSYWHGDPRIFAGDVINKTNHTSMRELFERTQKWTAALTEAGYIVKEMWELDFI